MAQIPVIALTGYLGAGKTSLLNHVLKAPGARIGVVINDFGEINVDAALVSGQIDEPASIAGGCICCLPDEGGLDAALEKLSDPRLRLDAIIVEASGMADPIAVSRIIRFSGAERVRPGGVVDVIDAARHFETVDRGGTAPARYGAASLVVVNKLDQVPGRDEVLARIAARVAERNPAAHVVGAVGGRVDPALLYDVAEQPEEAAGQLSLRELLVGDEEHHHVHAASVTVGRAGCIDPDPLLTLAENPPPGVYRLKGTVAVGYRDRVRGYVVNVVGPSVHVATVRSAPAVSSLVAIGTDLDTDAVRARLEDALVSCAGPAPSVGIRRLQRYRRLSI
ncbi:GTP-binding protein [uncultured Mycolicibacterium sp.]|uniref:CobW family GTP-binding protein n=1 Tax=uncultured Mycolicibacterium sp. TaxID=2320817 RepID=UPI00260AF980|nr:GTP-binding protein [uncultured Mycolicibacterium sp.]